jgi:hypothetical protein
MQDHGESDTDNKVEYNPRQSDNNFNILIAHGVVMTIENI